MYIQKHVQCPISIPNTQAGRQMSYFQEECQMSIYKIFPWPEITEL